MRSNYNKIALISRNKVQTFFFFYRSTNTYIKTMRLYDKFKTAIIEEQQEDVEQTTTYINTFTPKKLAQLGLGIINLQIANIRTGLGGKTILELQLDPGFSATDEINTSTLRTGDIVRLSRMSSSKPDKKLKKDGEESTSDGIDAVVLKVTTQAISISVDEANDDSKVLQYYNNTNDQNSRMWLVKLANSITYKRMLMSMDKVNALEDKNDIHRILLGESKYIPKPTSNLKLEFINDRLNDSQKEAIDFAINKSNITIIHGPPGTGKTYTLIELIQQLTNNLGEKVLVCGPSNISVDTILERLHDKYKKPEKLIRMGHPARLLPGNLAHSLEILSKSYGHDVIKDIEKDIQSTLSQIKKCKRYAERKALYQELKLLRKELKQREKKIVAELLQQSQVVISTLHGAGSFDLKGVSFDTIIIDEVSQSLKPQCWIPLLLTSNFKRLVIAGDNMQLPPTIKCKKNESFLGTTLFDRLVKQCDGDSFRKLLNVQYRMNQSIMEFPSMQLYDNKLLCDSSVKDISLLDLPGVEDNETTSAKCIWYDTQGGEFPEQINESIEGGDSKYNEMEILVVQGHLQKLLDSGVRPQDIGIISPYAAQVQLLKKKVVPEVEVHTVDGFQGREKEVIILSLVRSNDDREIGFLSEQRRLNVAITRPKRHLCIVGDLELLNQGGQGSNSFLRKWCKYVEDGEGEEPYEIEYPNLTDYLEN